MKNKVLDEKDRQLLALLGKDARASYRVLGEHIGLSAPAVKERMRRLEHAEIITGYSVQLNLEQMGKPIGAFVLVAVPYSQEKAFIRFVGEKSEIDSAHHLVGDSAFIVRVSADSMKTLEALLNELMRFGQTTTYMLLSRVK